MQAQRLARLTGLNAKELAGASVADLSEKLRWQIDPELLLFRRICGRVIKRDPVTGAEYPVPFATVHVEDTDCNLLGYFPPGWPWSWFFPFACRREEIATAVTDACGNFCVFVPRWDIDWILHFRRQRICFSDIFIRPSIRDLLEEILPRVTPLVPPGPQPDPPPFLIKDGGLTLRRAAELAGRGVAERLASLEIDGAVGASNAERGRVISARAFADDLPPPPPSNLRLGALGDTKLAQAAQVSEAVLAKSALQAVSGGLAQLRLDPKELGTLDFRRFIGPFLRCHDVLIPEWTPIVDVPDITFRVTQDVDGDGDQETIYSEGFFDVRWDAGPIPDVTLEASPIAVSGVACDTPEVPCQNVAAITFAGLMPVINPPAPADPYHDAVSGYGRRVNRPHPSGNLVDPSPNPLAEAPYTGVLQIYGCNHRQGAAYYRILYSYNGGSSVPFTGLTWPLWRVVVGQLQTTWPVADGNGWYPILPDSDNWFPAHLLLSWPTGSYPNGTYTLQVQLANAAKAPLSPPSAEVTFRVDNSRPAAQFTELRWRVAGGVWSAPVSLVCPTITRPMVGGHPADLEFMVSYQVAATHLRSVSLGAGGCGGGNPTLLSATSTAQHWHTNPADNSVSNSAVFGLAGGSTPMPQGAYNFSLYASSRAFNPSDPAGQLADWNYDIAPNYVLPSLPVAVVNA